MAAAAYSTTQATAVSTPRMRRSQTGIRAKSSIHAASAMPTNTRVTPGNAGSTVPANPSRISAPDTVHRIAVTVPV